MQCLNAVWIFCWFFFFSPCGVLCCYSEFAYGSLASVTSRSLAQLSLCVLSGDENMGVWSFLWVTDCSSVCLETYMGIPRSLQMLGKSVCSKGVDEINSYQCFSFLTFGDLSSRKLNPLLRSASVYQLQKQTALKLVC